MAINESCSSKQTFCALNKETVSSIDELNFTYSPSPTQFTQEISNEIWNEIIDEIIKIYNYGKRGTRNPINPLGITSFQSVTDDHKGNEDINSSIVSTTSQNNKHQSDYNIIPLDKYNEILSTIGLSSISDLGTIITEERFNTIKTTINNLKLNNTRCNNCNIKCNQKCQASSQCYCDCDCYCYNCSQCDCDCHCYYHTCSQGSGGCASCLVY